MNSVRIFCLFFFLLWELSAASTIGIATGSRTVDGRPLLFKNRDRTDVFPPDVQYYQGSSALGEYSYVYHKNLNQSYTRVRMGINSVGFGIGNTDSENLSGAGTGMNNGAFLALAIRTCANLQDFRNLLNSTNGARNVHAHIGVIDSSGAGSLFEVDGYTYFELPVIDSVATMANTAKYHPNAGPPAPNSTSPAREARAIELFELAPPQGLDYRYFVQEIIKDYCRNQQIENSMPIGQYQTNPVLSRYKTVAGAVIHGCKPGDDPLIESAMWLTLGEPSLSVALPFLPNVDEVFDFIRPVSTGQGMAGDSDRMRQLVYDYTNGRYWDQWADTFALVDIRALTFPLQDSLFDNYEQHLTQWRTMPTAQAGDSMKFWTYDIQQYAKTEYENIYQTVGVADKTQPPLKSFQLLPNYPNPFNASTTIDYYLPQPSEVNISVYDLTGQKVWSRTIDRESPGRHSLPWNASTIRKSGLSGGIYFLRVQAGKFSQIRKMVYIP